MPRTTDAERVRRHRVLLELLSQQRAGTQQELATLLRKAGFRVTQATISRDLDDLGATRRRIGDRHVYVLPEQNGPPSGWGLRMLPELVTGVAASGNLVVVRTFPGMAPTVGAVLDQDPVEGIIGTVAGDDTVIVVAAEGLAGKTLARRISGLATPAARAAGGTS